MLTLDKRPLGTAAVTHTTIASKLGDLTVACQRDWTS
jgi:hypothetical protein